MAALAAPDVSVIVPLFDKRKFVLRAVASVLAQVECNFELIVVDDGSRDGGGELVRAVQDPRLHLLGTPNRGPGAARNRGVRESRAPWIAFLDADDEWRPRFLAATRTAVLAAPQTVLAYTDVMDRTAAASIRRRDSGPIADYYGARLFDGIAASSSSVLVKREVFERCGGFREDYRYAEDIELWLRLTCAGPFYFIGEPLSLIEVAHADRLSRQTDYLQRAAGLGHLYESFERLRDAGAIPKAQLANTRRFMQHQRARQALHLALAGARLAALRLLAKVPIGRHTWRDHARVCGYALLPFLRPQMRRGGDAPRGPRSTRADR